MSRLRKFLAVLLMAGSCLSAIARAEVAIPRSPTPHYVLDEAGWLDPAEFRALDEKLEAYERETSSQFVVAIFKKLPEGAEVFDFSQRVFEAWKPGTAEKDNGAILFIFAADRKLRIHTGRGMEGVLPDARCKQIIANEIVPLLKNGDESGAVMAGADAMIAAAKGEYKGTGRTNLDEPEEEVDLLLFSLLIIFLIIISKIMSNARNSRNRRSWGGGSFGGGFGGGGGGFGGGSGGGGGFSGGGGDSGGGGAGGDW